MRLHLKKAPSYPLFCQGATSSFPLFYLSFRLYLSFPLRSDLTNANTTPSADCESSVGTRLRRDSLKLSCASDAHLWEPFALGHRREWNSPTNGFQSSISVPCNVPQKRWIRDWACLLLYHKVMFLLYCKKKISLAVNCYSRGIQASCMKDFALYRWIVTTTFLDLHSTSSKET